MPLYVQIVDANGHPDPVSSLADVLIDAIRTKGVGLFRGEDHVCEDLRKVVHEVIRDGIIRVTPAALHPCSKCFKYVTLWHTFPNGAAVCTECKDVIQAGN